MDRSAPSWTRPPRADVLLAAGFLAVSLVQVAVAPIATPAVSVLVAVLSTVPLAWRRACPWAAALVGTVVWLIPTPGGYLLVALTEPSPRQGSHRATVVTAARAAGLSWRQEFLVALAPLPEYEPRAMPDTAATTPPSLVDGRHAVTHVTLFAFRRPSGGDRA